MPNNNLQFLQKLYLSLFGLVVANLVALYGAVFWGWRIFDIMILYWFESMIIIGFFMLRILFARDPLLQRVVFFLLMPVPIVGFMIGHLAFILFIVTILSDSNIIHLEIVPQALVATRWAIYSMIGSHGLSFLINYLGKGEYKTATVEELQDIPTRRIITMHILVLLLFGGVLFIRNQIVAVAIFVIIKIVIDVFLHLEEHAKKLNV